MIAAPSAPRAWNGWLKVPVATAKFAPPMSSDSISSAKISAAASARWSLMSSSSPRFSGSVDVCDDLMQAMGDYTRMINDFSVLPSGPKEGKIGSYWYHEDTHAFFEDAD
ncbi:hypothetical protein LINPERHAP1_LOCUS21766 [Linum perenne]